VQRSDASLAARVGRSLPLWSQLRRVLARRSSTESGAVLALEKPQIDTPEGDIPFELGIEDIVDGDGEEATKGSKVAVHYVGAAFSSGEEFDASWDRGVPFRFTLGKGHVIPGWDAGVAGMKVGGRRKLTIPSAMAYGARGAGAVIKPHEPLVFVVDLLSVE
jgi:peptidylprolyl isomerase